jgi:HlyD family secretion protein
VDQLSQDLASLKIDREPKSRDRPRGPGRGIVIALVILGVIGAIGYFVVYPKIRSAILTKEVKTGDILLLSPAQAQVKLTSTGYVVALVAAKVAAKVPGRIAEIFVEEGDMIQKGDKVARLEDVDARSAIATAKARASAARARTQTARATLVETKVQLERERRMFEKGVSAKAEVEDLESRAGSLQASVRAAEAEAAAADAEAAALGIQLDNYIITSPVSGVVVDKLVEVGEGVSPGFGTPGVIEVVDLDSLVVEVDVPEGRLSTITEKQPAEIVLDAFSDQRFRGEVKEIGRRINRAKATVPVKVSFLDKPKPPAQALPEMAARVSFLEKAIEEQALKTPPKLVVPTKAVVKRNGADVVFVVDDGEVRMTPVTLGPPFGDGLELTSNLPSGTKVVLDPPADLKDGEKVKEKR